MGPTGPAGAQGPAGSPGAPGAGGPQGPPGPGARWAFVGPDGTILAQSGGITLASVVGALAGEYYLNFGSSLAGKVIVASPAAPASDNTFHQVLATLCGGGVNRDCPDGVDDDQHVNVFTLAPDGDPIEAHAFYLAVF